MSGNITQAARDAAADYCTALGDHDNFASRITSGQCDDSGLVIAIQRVIDAERERCAAVALTFEGTEPVWPTNIPELIATAILKGAS